MSDQKYEIEIITLRSGDGARQTINDFKGIESAAGESAEVIREAGAAAESLETSADGAKKLKEELAGIGEEAAAAGSGADQGKESFFSFDQALEQFAGRGATARDMFQGLTASLEGGRNAPFEVAKGFTALMTSMSLGPVGAFSIAVTLLITLMSRLSSQTEAPIKKLNELGETADQERQRLAALGNQEMEFTAAKKGLDNIQKEFAVTEAGIRALEESMKRLRATETEGRIAEIERGRSSALAAAGGDKDKESQINKKADAQVGLEKQNLELAEKTDAVNQAEGRILRTQQSIESTKTAQLKLEQEYQETLKAYVNTLRQAREVDIFPKNMSAEDIPAEMARLEAHLKQLNEVLATGTVFVNTHLGSSAVPIPPAKREEMTAEATNTKEAIEALRNFGALKESFEAQKTDIDAAREATKTALQSYATEINAMIVDLRNFRSELAETIRAQLDDANKQKEDAGGRLSAAVGQGAVTDASNDFSAATQRVNQLDALLRQVQQDLTASVGDLNAVTLNYSDAIRSVGAGAKDAAAAATKQLSESGEQVKTTINEQAAATKDAAETLKAAAVDASGNMAGSIKDLGTAVVQMGDVVTGGMEAVVNAVERVAARVETVAATAEAADVKATQAQNQIRNSR